MESVPSKEFEDFFTQEIANRGFTMSEIRSGGFSSPKLPALLEIRFPRTPSGGCLGFPDATAAYTFENASGRFVCRIHHRRGDVCYIEIVPEPEVDALARAIHAKFPGLYIARTSPPQKTEPNKSW